MVINYDGRRFRPAAGTGQESEQGRQARYWQDGDLLWGEFTGGCARRGALTGTCRLDGTLDFAYCMVLDSGDVVSGRCMSTPRILGDGRIQLHERWERYGPHAATGESCLEEIPPPLEETPFEGIRPTRRCPAKPSGTAATEECVE
jgi:hypothetical protein